MALVAWDESYSVGNALLDSDHHILINLLNQLYDAIDTGQSRDVVASVVNVLTEYVEHHFQREEAILNQVGFPECESHFAEHRILEGRFQEMRARWISGNRQVLDEEVLEFLKNWLTNHILVSDKVYRPWVETAEGAAGEGARIQ